MAWTKLNLQSVIDEKRITDSILRQLPENKPSLKVIQESIDKDALIEELLKSPKFKLDIGKVDGLKMTLDTLDRRYIHGGGFSNIASASQTVATGLDTLKFTGSGVSSVTKSGGTVTVNISASAGAFTTVAVTPTPDDTTLVYTAASSISAVVINGATYINGSSAMGGTISIVGTTITLPNPIGTGGDIYGIQ